MTAIPRPRLFTIGHGDLSLERFLSLLAASSIRVVADVRSNPASARFPWFERAALARELESLGLSYRWFRELGGLRPRDPDEAAHPALGHEWQRSYAAAMNRPEFHLACANLIGLAASSLTAVLCAEKRPESCHRSLLADKLIVMGARVVHILGPDAAEEHHLHPDLEVQPGLSDPGSRLIYSGRQLSML
jgi:uncharacterized protein (DUF488 family)